MCYLYACKFQAGYITAIDRPEQKCSSGTGTGRAFLFRYRKSIFVPVPVPEPEPEFRSIYNYSFYQRLEKSNVHNS